MCVIFVLIAANHHQEESKCAGIEVTIHGVNNNFFIDKKDVIAFINAQNKPAAIGNSIGNFNLRKLETLLENQVWIESADLYFNDQNVLQAEIEEREPVARVFTPLGHSFYLDSSSKILPLSNRLSARVPVFTGFPNYGGDLVHTDSMLLNGIVSLSLALQNDEFLQAMIEQIDINPYRKFELIPKLGKQIISFGTATDIPEKFSKLKAFYQQIILKAGWNRYSNINLEYAGQVVTKLRGKEDIVADSLRTLQLMEQFANRAQEASADSSVLFSKENDIPVDSSILLQSVERNEAPQENAMEDNAVTNVPDPIRVESSKPLPAKANPVKVIPGKAKTTAPEKKPALKIKKTEPVPSVQKTPKVVMPKKTNHAP